METWRTGSRCTKTHTQMWRSHTDVHYVYSDNARSITSGDLCVASCACALFSLLALCGIFDACMFSCCLLGTVSFVCVCVFQARNKSGHVGYVPEKYLQFPTSNSLLSMLQSLATLDARSHTSSNSNFLSTLLWLISVIWAVIWSSGSTWTPLPRFTPWSNCE